MVKHSVKYQWQRRQTHFDVLSMQRQMMENLTKFRVRQMATVASLYGVHWTDTEIRNIKMSGITEYLTNPLSEIGVVASPPNSDAL
jgi:hypothetical protein